AAGSRGAIAVIRTSGSKSSLFMAADDKGSRRPGQPPLFDWQHHFHFQLQREDSQRISLETTVLLHFSDSLEDAARLLFLLGKEHLAPGHEGGTDAIAGPPVVLGLILEIKKRLAEAAGEFPHLRSQLRI